MRSLTMVGLLVATSAVAGGFQPFHSKPQLFGSTTNLSAKTAKKKKKSRAESSAGGGFGRKVTKTTNQVGDYDAFPALEASVVETLVPSQDASVGSLPMEILDRLDQIYGLSNFNSANQHNDDEEKGPMSFDELFATDVSSGPASADPLSDLIPTQKSNLDIAELLKEIHTEGSAKDSPSVTALPLSDLPAFGDFRVLHVDPLVLSIDNFFTNDECDRYIAISQKPSKKRGPLQTGSKTVGKDTLAKAQRTSTTWFHHFEGVPELVSKASRLLGLDGIDRWEEPQTVRYRRGEKFTWHLDALAPSDTLQDTGGQRVATLLVYLTDLETSDGGATVFRDLGGSDGFLKVHPKKGSALLFFPAAGGIPNAPFDIRTLHCGEVVSESASQDKWIGQLWLRQGTYTPTAPPGNTHAAATNAISEYCTQVS